VRNNILGLGPLFPTPPHPAYIGFAGVLSCVLVGLLAGALSIVLTQMVYLSEDAFHKLPIHWMWWPALGGLIVGLGGLIEPRALGVGYDSLQALLDDQFTLHALIALLLVKAFVWSVALGSGTSGGVLAPLLIMGGALGAIVGRLVSPGDAPMFALLGMAAMMGGTMRSPLTATIFGVELTGNIHALLPLVAACAAAHCLTVLLLKRSILTERIARRGHHLTREYSVDPFELVRVKEVMVHEVDTLPATMTAGRAIEFFSTAEHRHKSYPLVDANGILVGMVSRTDTLKWIVNAQDEQTPLSELSTDDGLLVAFADELVGRVADRMSQEDIGRVPVVRPEDRRLIGIVSRKDLFRVRAALLTHEHERSAPLRVSRS
jgi:CBS domain-containing protein